jgi:phage shock protein PspC (stress-responsive transcriptional regulator)
MKKTINISLGGMSFVLEEDAFQKLETYLNQVKARFNSLEGGSEIVSDIEDRLAEQFASKVGAGGIVTVSVVEEMTLQMGDPADFGPEGQKKSSPESHPSSGSKRLMRNPDDVIIAGVASGIAAYLDIDPIWVRLIFALSVLFGGFGVILYIVLWVVMPEAKTEIDKMQMKGEPINLKAIENTVKERVEEFKKKDQNRLKAFFASLARLVAKIVKGIFPVVFKIIGIIVAVAGSLALAALVISAISLIFNVNSPYVDFPLKAIAHGAWYYIAVTGAALAVFVPLVLLILLGSSLISGRASATRSAVWGLLGLWVVATAFAVSAAFRLAPEAEVALKNSGYYIEESRELAVKDFSSLKASSAYRLNITRGNEFKVTAQGRKMDLDKLKSQVENGTLNVFQDQKFTVCLFCLNRPLNLDIQMPELKAIALSGASQAKLAGFESKQLEVKLSGASRVSIDGKTEKLHAELSGASRLGFVGTASEIVAKLSGASRAELQAAQVQSANLQLSGASRAWLKDVKNLKAKLSGASRVYYASAEIIDSDTSGSSSLIRQENPQPDNETDFYPFPPEGLSNRFKDSNIQFSFSPQLVMLSTTTSEVLDPTSSLPRGENTVLLNLPKENFPDSNFISGYALVSRVANLNNPARCRVFLGPDGKESDLKDRVVINGTEWWRTDLDTAAAGTRRSQEIYHTGQGNTCYEVSLNYFFGNIGNYPENSVREVAKQEVWDLLKPIVETFKFVE